MSKSETLNILIEALSDPNDTIREESAAAIGQIGSDAAIAVPSLAQALKDSNSYVRAASAIAIQQIGSPAAEEAIPALVDALSDEDDYVSSNAKDALIALGDAATSALSEAIRSGDTRRRRKAAIVLTQIEHGG